MSKKIIFLASVLLFVFTIVIPADAQTSTPSVSSINQGFLSKIATFFSTVFHHQNGQAGFQTQGQNEMPMMQGTTPGQPAPSETTRPIPSGQPTYQIMQQYRLDQLVKEGKITQTQEQQILTELTTVQNQLKTWAQSEGIDPSYVVGGPMMMESIQSGNNSQGQTHPMFQGPMHYRGQSQQDKQGGIQGGAGQKPQGQ